MVETTPLLCLPFAGAGAAFFAPWRAAADPAITVVPLHLPGRERLIARPPHTDLATAAEELARQAVVDGHRGPLALYGHSMGAVLAYEIAHRLVALGVTVAHLVVSGSPGPWDGRAEKAGGLDDEQFLARVQDFAGYRHPAFDIPEARELLLPTLRADVRMHEDYAPTSERPLDCPVTAIRGADDHLVSALATRRWRMATSGRFSAVEVPGGHMFPGDDPRLVLDIALDALRTPVPHAGLAG